MFNNEIIQQGRYKVVIFVFFSFSFFLLANKAWYIFEKTRNCSLSVFHWCIGMVFQRNSMKETMCADGNILRRETGQRSFACGLCYNRILQHMYVQFR